MSTAFGCVNNTIRLRSGLYLDLADPQPEQFTFGDIAGALAKICRFGSQIDRFYSVAEHSVLCQTQAFNDGHDENIQAAVLMHDAAEAFVGDIVKPLKIMLPDYKIVESRMELCIFDKYGVDVEANREIVTEIDRSMLINERNQLFRRKDGVTWTDEDKVRSLDMRVLYLTPNEAEEMFVEAARELELSVDR